MNTLRSPIMHASRDIESCRTPSNDERMADWASRYFLRGEHRRPAKPRIRITVPLASVPPTDAEPEPQRENCGDYSTAREYAEAQSEPEPITSYADIRGV